MSDTNSQPAMRPIVTHDVELFREGARFIVDLELTNPTDYPFAVRQVDYRLFHGNTPFLNGFADLAASLEPGLTTRLSVPLFIRTDVLLDRCPEVEDELGDRFNGRADFRLHLTVGDEADILLPGSADFTLPLPLAPTVEIERLRFDTLGWNHADGQLVLRVTNRCLFDLDLGAAGLHIQIGPSVKLHTHRALDLALAPAGQQTVAVPLSFSPANIGYNAFAALNGGAADYLLQADVLAATPWGPLEFACEHRGRAEVVSPGGFDVDGLTSHSSAARNASRTTG